MSQKRDCAFIIGVKMKNILLMAFLTVAVAGGCSNITFNERYANANWNKVIIAPFEGDKAKIAEEEFEHSLAVSSQLTVIPASVVLLKLEEHSLKEKYKENPTKAVVELAQILKADGIIAAKVESHWPKSKRSSDLVSAFTSIHAKLIDASNMAIVLSSQQQSSSIFSSANSEVRDVSKAAISEFQEGFASLKGKN